LVALFAIVSTGISWTVAEVFVVDGGKWEEGLNSLEKEMPGSHS